MSFFANLTNWKQRLFILVTLLLTLQSIAALDSNALLQDLDDDIPTWNRLKRDAGYYTEDGLWRGGLFLRARNEWFDGFTCNHLHGSYCHSWVVVKVAQRDVFNGTCFCTRHSSRPYCTTWECSETDAARRIQCNPDGSKCGFVSSSSTIITNCTCLKSAENKKYCLEWSCDRTNFNGQKKEHDYRCIKEDATGNYCFRWNSSYTAGTEIRASVCECFERGSLFCHHWRCKERKVRICEANSGQWCNVWFSIFIGGPFGALTILLLVFMRPTFEESIIKNLYIVCRALMISSAWLIGVLIWGGVRGLPWVLAMWFITIVVLFLYLLYRNKRKYGQNIWIKSLPFASKLDSQSPPTTPVASPEASQETSQGARQEISLV
eukprot:g4417.t1